MIQQHKMKQVFEGSKKKERFIRFRTWMSVITSYFFADRGTIPHNIGNNILIQSNQYITKYGISAMIVLTDLSETTPIGFTSKVIHDIKSTVAGLTVDVTIKNSEYFPSTTSNGISSRFKQWKATLDNEYASKKSKDAAARLLYSYDVVVQKERTYKSRIYITLRALEGHTLKAGITKLRSYLDSHGIGYKVIKNDIETHLKYTALLSNKAEKKISDVPTIITSAEIIGELLPMTQGLNADRGSWLGIDRKNRQPYLIDFRSSSNAKNIYVVGLSGFGKTFLVIFWLLDFLALGFNAAIMDIKGNEFTFFTRAFGGMVLPMGPEGTYYVNTWRLNPDMVHGDPITYFDEMVNMSKQEIMILAKLDDKLVAHGEAFVDRMINDLYNYEGVMRENVNTWFRSNDLNPYKVYEFFVNYLSPDIRNEFSDVIEYFETRLPIYMSRNGSQSHIFREEYDYGSIMSKRVITFDFGYLNSSRASDESVFKLRVLFMNYLMNQFSRFKKEKGEWTVNIDEESQIAADYVLNVYKENFMLGRAQNKISILLGNSVESLVQNPISQGIMANINILCVGMVHKQSRDYLVNQFGLDKYIRSLEKIYTSTDFDNTFLLVNKMEKKGATAWLKAYVPTDVADGKIFRTVDTVK